MEAPNRPNPVWHIAASVHHSRLGAVVGGGKGVFHHACTRKYCFDSSFSLRDEFSRTQVIISCPDHDEMNPVAAALRTNRRIAGTNDEYFQPGRTVESTWEVLGSSNSVVPIPASVHQCRPGPELRCGSGVFQLAMSGKYTYYSEYSLPDAELNFSTLDVTDRGNASTPVNWNLGRAVESIVEAPNPSDPVLPSAASDLHSRSGPVVGCGEGVFQPTHYGEISLPHATTDRSKHDVIFYYQNVGGMNSDVLDYHLAVSDRCYDVIVFVETWLDSRTLSIQVFESEYEVFRCDRNPKNSRKSTGGGVLVAKFVVLSMALAIALGAAIENPTKEVDTEKEAEANEETKQQEKRGLSDYGHGFSHHQEMLSEFRPAYRFEAPASLDDLKNFNNHAHQHMTYDWRDEKHTMITKKVPVPYKVEIEKHTITEKKVPVHVDRPVPYRVEVERKVPVYIEKKVPVHVDRPVPYPVKVPYPVEVEKKVPFYVEKKVHVDRPVPYPVEVEKKVSVFVEKKVPVHVNRYVPYPVEVKVPVVHKVHVEVPKPYAVHVSKPFPVYIEKEVVKHVDRPVHVEVEKKVPVTHVHKVEVPKPFADIIEKPVLLEKHHHHHHHDYQKNQDSHKHVQQNSAALKLTGYSSEPAHDGHHNEHNHHQAEEQHYQIQHSSVPVPEQLVQHKDEHDDSEEQRRNVHHHHHHHHHHYEDQRHHDDDHHDRLEQAFRHHQEHQFEQQQYEQQLHVSGHHKRETQL
ncbi:uncharacterized protein LOC135711306 [Ochlerotatus camptorhynchus]|uniref:uncharacterized protein LOC135711306 n=1 Tax=Ochlerotatus camptorhynchus TaxID=644619 RepID=UPI0031CFEB69